MAWKKGNRVRRIREHEATGRVRQIFEETKHAFGLPYVDFVYQALAAYPEFLDLHWRTFKCVIESGEFFTLVERLRADAYTRAHNYFNIRDIRDKVARMNLGPEQECELTRVIELSQYGRPLLLLVLAAQFQAFESEIGRPETERSKPVHPTFSEAPVLVEEDTASPFVRRVFEELKRNLNLPFVPGEYRSLARWPEFLKIYWNGVKDAVASPVYEASLHALQESAFVLARELPGPIRLSIPDLSEAGMNDADVTSVVRITELFLHSLSASALNLAVAKIGMEGGSGLKQERETAEEENAA